MTLVTNSLRVLTFSYKIIHLGFDKEDKLNTDFESIFNPDGSLRAAHGLKANGAVLAIEDSKLSRYVKTDRDRFVDIEVTPAELFNEMKASQVNLLVVSTADSAARLIEFENEIKYGFSLTLLINFICSKEITSKRKIRFCWLKFLNAKNKHSFWLRYNITS